MRFGVLGMKLGDVGGEQPHVAHKGSFRIIGSDVLAFSVALVNGHEVDGVVNDLEILDDALVKLPKVFLGVEIGEESNDVVD